MDSGIGHRCRLWLERLWNGEVALITDDRWLPAPFDMGRSDETRRRDDF